VDVGTFVQIFTITFFLAELVPVLCEINRTEWAHISFSDYSLMLFGWNGSRMTCVIFGANCSLNCVRQHYSILASFPGPTSICRARFANFALIAWSWRRNNISPGESSSQVRVLEQLK
jgi:hypothetical protein